MINARGKIIQLENGAHVALDEYGDPEGLAGHFLPRLAKFPHDGRFDR